MHAATDAATASLAIRIFANLLTVGAALGWAKFADVRHGQLDRPSVHHLVWLRVLLTVSSLSLVLSLLSVAANLG